jgi:FtsP/CotA-like multicopper oxidase with cupredoxin domain
MLKRFNRLLALAAALFMGFGLQANPQAADAPVANRTMAPTPGGDKSAITERVMRRRTLANAREAAAARQQAALKAKGGKINPAVFGANPINADNAAKFAKAAAAKSAGLAPGGQAQGLQVLPGTGVAGPGFQLQQPDYMMGTASNWHNTKPLKKFVDGLPGLGKANANNLGNFIPVATPDTTSYPGSDYYEIGVVEYKQQLHSELAPTRLRGYKDLSATAEVTTNVANSNSSQYLGPVIIAQKDRAVRVKMRNLLPFNTPASPDYVPAVYAADGVTVVTPQVGTAPSYAGDLFIPVDTTIDGAGTGPLGGTEVYTQNRVEFHLHGGLSPWISDGTPHQWITPAGDPTSYKKGAVFQNVPDMVGPGTTTPTPSVDDGIATYFWSNQQSGRLMFYHDHSFGLTRLNVYAGTAAGYLIVDDTEKKLIAEGTLPNQGGGVYTYGIPLVIQDKTFVNTATLGTVGTPGGTDPTWDVAKYGGDGSLWYPHVYMVNQNPADMSGSNGMGRWDYAQWFWPPVPLSVAPGDFGLRHGSQPLLAFDAAGNPIPVIDPATGVQQIVNGQPVWQLDPNGTEYPGTPNPSLVPEAFMDTPLVNGAAYPTITVQPAAYRFRILNASNDRFWNLSFFQADASGTEVSMVPSAPTPGWPATWPTDGRAGGVPNPATAGPSFIQIGNESGFLAAPVVIAPQPVGYNYNRRDIVVLNVADKGLYLGAAERADVVVDFSAYAGKTLILYNDAPAPMPAFDVRYDYYTGMPDNTATGGAASTLAGYGPNTRTVMQFVVAAATPAPAFDLAKLNTAFQSTATSKGAFEEAQHLPIVPQLAYNSALNKTLTPAEQLLFQNNVYARIQDHSIRLPFPSMENGTPIKPAFANKAIQELFELNYGRMNATLGIELPLTNAVVQTTVPLGYTDPTTEDLTDGTTQYWKITHNGVDTHPVHFHLFDVQIINRVGWDGAVRMPEPNELGWKETVKMSPLEDIIVAFRPISPRLPAGMVLPLSSHSPDVTKPATDVLFHTATDGANTGNQVSGANTPLSFDWEYVWHCHILGHEENDFMRPMVLHVATGVPAQPTLLTANLASPGRANLAWTDNATDETGFLIQRAPYSQRLDPTAFTTIGTVVPNVWTYSDFTVVPGTGYTYQVMAYNQAGNSSISTTATPGTTDSVNIPAAVPVQVSGSVFTFDGVSNLPLANVVLTINTTNPVSTSTVTTDGLGAYTAALSSGMTVTLTPTLGTYLFAPASITVGPLVANLAGQNFWTRPANITISGTVPNVPAGTIVSAFDGITTVTANVVAGAYSLSVPNPYTGTVTPSGPSASGLLFTPVFRSYNAVATNQTAQNFAAQVVISGTVTSNALPLGGVTLAYTGGSTTTAANGKYTITLPAGASTTLTPSKTGYLFTLISPALVSPVLSSTTQDYTAVAGVEIAGQVYINTVPIQPLAGVTITFSNGGGSAVTDANGFYSNFVLSGWSGTATPSSSASYAFNPTVRNFTNVTTLQSGRNFIATAVVTYSGNVTRGGAALPGVRVAFSNGGGSVLTNASGNYTITLNSGWTGTITPTLNGTGTIFSPASVVIAVPVTLNATQNFSTVQSITGRARVRVAGQNVGLAGVTITLSTGGTATTDANGNFTVLVPTGWAGSLSASDGGVHAWTPAIFNYTLAPVVTNITGLRFNGL